jgi:sulfate/thiosulfate transport system substrate-binding protein
MFQAQRRGYFFLLGIVLSLAIAACSIFIEQTAENNANEVNLNLVSYTVTRDAYQKIIPLFAQKWQKETGQKVTFQQSYGSSSSQVRAVIDGLEADVIVLAMALDIQKLEQAKLIQSGWEQEFPNNSIVAKSVVALALRDDLNLKVETWADLANDNIEVITANPKTSGGARWNFLALWGAITQAGGSEEEAEIFVEKVFKNTPIFPKNAREASDMFYTKKQGDVLINYENEIMLLTKEKGYKLPYFVPTNYNISIDNPVAIVDQNVEKHKTRKVAEAFAKFLYTPEAQKAFAETGFRSINPEIVQEFKQQYPEIKNLFTVQDLGGWDYIQNKFFEDGAMFDQMLQKLGK